MTRRWDHCEDCRAIFQSSRILQDEARWLAATQGPGAANEALRERLEPYHDEHQRVSVPIDE